MRVPVTVVRPRVGSLALAALGRTRNVQAPRAAAAGRRSLALNRILATVLSTAYGLALADSRLICFSGE